MSTELERPSPAQLDIQYPVKEIFENLPIEYPQVYRNIPLEVDSSLKQVIVLTGFSGAGKDTVLDPIVESKEAYQVITATSRKRSEKNEAADKYIWMRERKEDESIDLYYENLIKEYDLIEKDPHYSGLYGLPRSSLLKQGVGMPVIRVDINGVVNHRRDLSSKGFQPVTVAVMPDSWGQLYNAIIGRGRECEEKAIERFYEDVANVELYRENINYFIHNSRFSDIEGVTGLDLSVDGLRYLVSKYRNH